MNYDAIVIGAGAGGGIAAALLSESGARVLLLERGKPHSFAMEQTDHLRNHRLSQYGQNTGPGPGNPRVFVDAQQQSHVVQPHEGQYHNNAVTVGGGTVVYGGQAWRFLPDDFAMASRYGVPKGSSLADWPIRYTDLAPYYERAEHEIGIAGDSETSAAVWPRAKPYPMPAVDLTTRGRVLQAAAHKLGWRHFTPPLAINTRPYQGRPACTGCTLCVGFACHVDAKNGTQNTMVPRAIASGNCTLLTDAHVLRIDMDNAQTAKGVTYVDATGTQHHATAGIVIVAAGAIETARLFLNSATSAHPNGIGNHSDQLGRHLQGHVYPRAIGLLPDAVIDHQGPGVSICTTQFNHGNPDIIGGGMLADEFITLPIIFWKRFLPPDVPRWGKAAKDFMRYAYPRFIDVTGPIQDIPSPDSRVAVDPRVRDRFGLPVARLSGTTHPESIRTAAFMFERAREWIEAAGVTRWWGTPPTLGLSASQHQAGTCRMGDDPATSVTDRWGKIHGIRNIYVADGSLHVTNGGFNPFLTIMANAFRVVDGIVQRGN